MKKLLKSKLLSLFLAFTMMLGLVTIPVKEVKAEVASYVVISEAYGGGGNNGATYKQDFIELYNPTDTDIDLSGWKVEYASVAGKFSQYTDLNGVIKANGYFLIQQAAGENKDGTSIDLPTPDATGKLPMSGTNCKVRLTDNNGTVVDFVGIGTANESEGNKPAKGMSNSLSVQRKDNDGSSLGETNGWDTNNNEADFYAKEPTPRNSKYSLEIIELLALKVDENVTLEIGESKKLSVLYEPENTTEKGLKFESLNVDIATVDSEGNVTAIKEGETTIKITSTVKENIIAETKVIVNKGEDKRGPEITNIYPSYGENLRDLRRPEIKATITDESGIDVDSVNLYLDGESVTANITESIISYKVSEDLIDGQHTVKLEVKDTLGNLSEKEWNFTVGEVSKNLYFGQLHSHTNLSDGTGSIDEAYTYAKNIAGIDFLAVTDHSNWFDNDSKANLSDGSASEEWKLGQATADKYNLDDEFVAMYAYEMSWSGSTGGYGHMNTFNTPGFETRTNSAMNLKAYYDTLKTQPQSISMFNHPGKTFGDFTDFAHYDKEIGKLVTLIEVGNGEGPVGGSGYFPSYEYYTRALDKGWQVAPTNGQDNHKGKWGDANTTRTVIEAPRLTRESIYQAMRDRRVYSTEDENLRISYEINGNTMGSILEKTDVLNFNVDIKDTDKGDTIEKISIIGDGGKVVKSIDNVNSESKNWTFTLDKSQSSYYFVQVEQTDKQKAVTSPIWVGEKELVGLSSVNVNSEVILTNEKFDVEATVYNNELNPIENVKVEYFLENSNEVIFTDTIEKIDTGKTMTSKFNTSLDKAGNYKFNVKVTATINGTVREFNGSTEVRIYNENEVSKVIIDGSHQNYYVTGDYAGKMTTLTAMMASHNVKPILNMDTITDKVLDGADLLILTDPQSTSKSDYGLTPQKYSDEELKAIGRFVEKGGNIIISSKADYGDGIDEYGSAEQNNSVLRAINAKVRFNDDQAIDRVNNGGQAYRLYLNNYNTEHPWFKGVDTSKTYSFYSGSTLIMPEDLSNIDVLVRGHSTTLGDDADKKGDNTPITEGNMVALAVETLGSGSKVVVSGATFLSDFETDSGEYSNTKLTENIIKSLANVPEIEVSKIEDVRVDLDGDNNPDRFGETVVVEGYVTAASNAAAPGNTFFDVLYIQDETAGLTVFGVSTLDIKLGQKVRVTGKVSSYLGDAQVALNNELNDVEIIDEGINLVEPKLMTTYDSMLESNEGWLVKVKGNVTRIEGQSIFVNDGSGEARVYVEGYIRSSKNPGVDDEWKSRVNVGDTISAIGLASEDPEGHRLRVRDSAEIEIIKNGDDEPNPEDVKVTGVSLDKTAAELKINESLELKATISPSNATNKEVTWSSSDENILKVDENGKVTAVSAGKATITVTTKDGEFKASCEITVKNEEVPTTPTTPIEENVIYKIENPNGKNEVIITNPSNEIKLEIRDIEAIKTGNGYLEIKNGENIIKLPFSLIDKELLKEGSSIIFEMKVKEDTTITSGIKGVKKVFEFNLYIKNGSLYIKDGNPYIKDGNEVTNIHSFKDGVATITLKLSDEDLKGLNKENLAVFYYNEATKSFEQLETTINGNEVTFKTSHFSKFIIAEKTKNESGITLPATGGNNPTYLLIIAVLVIGAGGILLLKRKNKDITNK
ncbi:MAG: LPXTG cell wall anchor domain-containing protein [Clostridium sartagoforme]|nr:LPXTG cell wall anchor domain-containing protein [Clostridium sartagoforme]